ncbi:hypothetical protein [Oerskovia flava]|uniref:hypothetical protein n=1 Tax=Oerskovia flava TaxID=2986422 RepID=UPI002240B29F|nr:hypothetical protein [Oerskovia sp. JB1-3-2]
MSTRSSAAAARPVPTTEPARRATLTPLPGGVSERASRPRLHAVRAPLQSPSRIPFLVACMSILAAALLGALLLNTTMAHGSYEMSTLRWEVGQVAQDTQSLATQVRQAETGLPDRARSLGMVPSEELVMLRLSDGEVLGAAEAEAVP